MRGLVKGRRRFRDIDGRDVSVSQDLVFFFGRGEIISFGSLISFGRKFDGIIFFMEELNYRCRVSVVISIET